MHNKLSRITGIVILLLISLNISSQVTVGSNTLPINAGVLDVKTKESTVLGSESVTNNKNITSETGGIILPRVKLKNILTLEPFIATTDPDLKVLKLKHTGMLVYNINNSTATETDPLKVFKEGIYMWDGSRWSLLVREEFNFFHMPTFNLDISKIGTFNVDLYAEYTKQFAREGSAIPNGYPTLVKNPSAVFDVVPIYKRNEIDYYVTYGDNSIVKDIKVSNTGILTYTVNPTTPITPVSYMNIVFVIK